MISRVTQNDADAIGLQELLRSLQKQQKEFPENDSPEIMNSQALEPALQRSLDSQPSSPNLMSQNFTSFAREESKYLDAQLNSKQISKQMNLSQQSTMVSVLDAFGGITGPSLYDPHSNPKSGCPSEWRIRKYLEQKDTEKMMEDMQEELRRKKEAERSAAAKALASGEMLDEDYSGATPVDGEMTAPLPEFSDVPPTPVPEIMVYSTSGIDVPSAPELEVTAPVSTAIRSINVKI